MKVIDLNDRNTLPPVGEIIRLYNERDFPLIGKMEFNRWDKPMFFQFYGGYWFYLEFIPKGWEELEESDHD